MVRIVDVAAALRRRRYRRAGVLTLDVAPDRLAPWNGGQWRLAAGADAGDVTPAQVGAAENPLRLSVKALASLYIGHRSATELAAWGLVSGPPAAIEAADAIFGTSYAPHCAENF